MNTTNNLKNSDIKKQNENKSDIINKKRKRNSSINTENLNKKLEETNFERINEEMVFNEDKGTNILNKFISMDNHDNNNYIYKQRIINKEENENVLTSKNNSFDLIKKLLKDKDISDTNNENNFFDNNYIKTNRTNEKINIYNNFFINNPLKNDNIIENCIIKNKQFECLTNSSADSFTINSKYENIDKISKYKYSIDPIFRQKVRKYIIQTSFSRFNTLASAKIKNAILKENNMAIKNKNNFSNSIEKFNNENTKNHLALKKQLTKQDFKSIISDKRDISYKKKPIKKMESANIIYESDNTFYTRFKTINQANKTVKIKAKNKKVCKYEEQISKNIEKNQQNLNNPEEYFSGFFNNLLSKNNYK